MSSTKKITINYVTSSEYKIKENEVLVAHGSLEDGTPISDFFEFRIRRVPIKEVLEVDLNALVMAEVTKAYSEIRVPCVVEHAGLVFKDLENESYPGGLTKPMWNALRHRFVSETHSQNRPVIARAVVAYCDGMKVLTFVGETPGTIASEAKEGNHRFYWDSVFIPNNDDGSRGNKTYAEIVEEPTLGLKHKVLNLSQSTRAMLLFLEHRRSHSPGLWSC